MTLLTLIILAFASFRITRLALFDTILEGTRLKFHIWLTSDEKAGNLLWSKIYEATSCSWCFGVYVSLLVFSVYFWVWPWDFAHQQWIEFIAVAGMQGYLHAYDPGEEIED